MHIFITWLSVVTVLYWRFVFHLNMEEAHKCYCVSIHGLKNVFDGSICPIQGHPGKEGPPGEKGSLVSLQ